MKPHKDKCRLLPLQGTNPGNGTGWEHPGRGAALWRTSWWSAIWTGGSCVPRSKAGQQRPRLYDQEHGQEIQRRDYPGYCIHISDPQYRKDVGKLEQVQ